MFKILLVEDAMESQLIVRGALRDADVEILNAETLAGARAELDSRSFDLIVLDLSLPDGNGLSLLKHLSEKSSLPQTPVILLTSEADVAAKVEAFNLGADDYLVKPIDPIEFRARVQARQRKSKAASAALLRRGDLSVDIRAMKVILHQNGRDIPVDLTTKEFKILCCLAGAEGRVYSRNQLVQEVWGGVHVLERTIDSHVCSLRKKLGPCSAYIQSIPNEGYCLESTALNARKAS